MESQQKTKKKVVDKIKFSFRVCLRKNRIKLHPHEQWDLSRSGGFKASNSADEGEMKKSEKHKFDFNLI